MEYVCIGGPADGMRLEIGAEVPRVAWRSSAGGGDLIGFYEVRTWLSPPYYDPQRITPVLVWEGMTDAEALDHLVQSHATGARGRAVPEDKEMDDGR